MTFTEQLRQRKELLTVTEVAELLKIAPKTVRSWADKGILPATKIGGQGAAGDWRIEPTKLADWYENRQNGGQQ